MIRTSKIGWSSSKSLSSSIRRASTTAIHLAKRRQALFGIAAAAGLCAPFDFSVPASGFPVSTFEGYPGMTRPDCGIGAWESGVIGEIRF
jgi:hypothetical protein